MRGLFLASCVIVACFGTAARAIFDFNETCAIADEKVTVTVAGQRRTLDSDNRFRVSIGHFGSEYIPASVTFSDGVRHGARSYFPVMKDADVPRDVLRQQPGNVVIWLHYESASSTEPARIVLRCPA